jgi:GntR family transcriptional regulator
VSRTGLTVDPSDPRPIWRQIEEGIEQLVASRALAPGAAVPSVRDLALELRVNPATVAKAFQRLVDAGLLESRRGAGTFVADKPPAMNARARRERLAEAATRLATVATTLGAGADDAHAALDDALVRLRAAVKESR